MGSCKGCGSTKGDPEMSITRGATYRRSVLYKRMADGSQVPLDAADYSAELIIRRSLSYPDAMLTLTDADGLALSTEDDAIRVTIQIDADKTALLPIGSGFRYTLTLALTADPDIDTTVLLNSTARVIDTALGP